VPQPLEHKRFDIPAALALGLIKRVPRERTGNAIERDKRGRWVAFGDYHKVGIFLCENWVRDRLTGARGVTLPRSSLVDIYEKQLDDDQYAQSFLMCMFCLSVKDDPYAHIVKTHLWKERLYHCQMLGWNAAEYDDILHHTIVPAVQQYLSDPDGTLHNWLFAMGRPVESDTYGEGELLASPRVLAQHLKGGKLFGHDDSTT